MEGQGRILELFDVACCMGSGIAMLKYSAIRRLMCEIKQPKNVRFFSLFFLQHYINNHRVSTVQSSTHAVQSYYPSLVQFNQRSFNKHTPYFTDYPFVFQLEHNNFVNVTGWKSHYGLDRHSGHERLPA